jgi:hypothetical protein
VGQAKLPNFPEPIVVDSGNGYHLYYQSSCAPGHASWRYMLGWLARTFNTEGAKIDTSVADAARIARLPGSINRKGEDTLERPHRMCRVLSYPEVWTEPPPIYNVARAHGYTDDYDRAKMYAKRQADGDAPELVIDEEGLVKMIGEFPDHLDLHRVAHKDGRTYLYLASCPFNGGPHRDQRAGKTAIILNPDTVGFKCFSDDCTAHTFQELLGLLKRQTGRKPSMPVYGPPDYSQLYKLYPRWGGVDDVNLLDRIEVEAARLEEEWEYETSEFVHCMYITDPEFRWDFDSFEVEKSGELAGMSTNPTDWGLSLIDLLPTVQRVKMENGWKPSTWVGGRPRATVGQVLDAICLDPSIRGMIHPLTTSMKAYRDDEGCGHYHNTEVIYDTSCLPANLLDWALAVAEGSRDCFVLCRLQAALSELGEFLGVERLWHIFRDKHRPIMEETSVWEDDESVEYRLVNVNPLHDEHQNRVSWFDDLPTGSAALPNLF